jgi:branched-chain amino acid transport system ATP-binding protein
MAAQSTLSVDSVSKSYGGVRALSDVSLSVRAGEIAGLLGANGAGKTTLLDIIGGEQDATAGRVLLNGAPLEGRPHRRARRGLARTFQHPQVAMELTVLENVSVGLAVRELGSQVRTLRSILRAALTGRPSFVSKARAACEAVGLDRTDRQAHQLAFGELRLLEVARALIQEPQVLLLDEPFPGLDDDGVELLSAAIRGVAERGSSVVLVDHNVSLVEGLVGSVTLLARGKVAFTGSVRDCLASEEFHREYIGGVPA